jgi:hypothetical protein
MTDEEKQKLQELSDQLKGTEVEIGPFYRDETKNLEAEMMGASSQETAAVPTKVTGIYYNNIPSDKPQYKDTLLTAVQDHTGGGGHYSDETSDETITVLPRSDRDANLAIVQDTDNSSVGITSPQYGAPSIAPMIGNDQIALQPFDHFYDTHAKAGMYEYNSGALGDTSRRMLAAGTDRRTPQFMLPTEAHFLPDETVNGTPFVQPNGIPSVRTGRNGETYTDFAASSTLVNPTGSIDKQRVLDGGLGPVEDSRVETYTKGVEDLKTAPISPLYPFFNMDPNNARRINLLAYNRFHIPVADLEFRKGFRHIFITRPECYIMGLTGSGSGLSEQCRYDEDFASAFYRTPHLLKLLSPRYVCPITQAGNVNSNINMLLSNRVIDMGNVTNQISIDDGSSKSITGYTVALPHIFTSMQGGSLDLTFRDTKDFEIYEFARLWMLYMEKRHRGIFSPPFNGYQIQNGFLTSAEGGSLPETGVSMSRGHYSKFHPYDRAIEFPCTIFDVITNESDTRILHITEYIGCYPVSVTNPFSNESNQALSESKVTVSFRYQGMIENRNTIFMHFNYNAGIVNDIGEITETVKTSLPFLVQDTRVSVMPQYLGAAGMWTGPPFIMLGDTLKDPSDPSNIRTEPFLAFMPIADKALSNVGNLGIVNVTDNKPGEVAHMHEDTDKSLQYQTVNYANEAVTVSDAAATQRIQRTQAASTTGETEEKSFLQKVDDALFDGGFQQIGQGISDSADNMRSATSDINSMASDAFNTGMSVLGSYGEITTDIAQAPHYAANNLGNSLVSGAEKLQNFADDQRGA